MKPFVCSLILFSLLLTLTIVNAITLTTRLGDICAHLDSIPAPAPEDKDLTLQLRETEAVLSEWSSLSPLISLTVSHEDLMTAEEALSSLVGAAKSDDGTEFLSALDAARYALRHMRDMVRISADAFF